MHFIFIGPNYAWHCDGYDKLKPYGLPIHGCIDGYIINIAKFFFFKQVFKENNVVKSGCIKQ